MAGDETKTMAPKDPGDRHARRGDMGPGDAMGLPGPHLRPGATVGRYVVLFRVGNGGMGVVYAAYDPKLDRKVALKILRSDLDSSHRRELSLREAQAMARLRHPNVMTVYDIGEEEVGTFLAMEYVEGRNLRSWLRETPRSWAEILAIFLEAGRGLAAAHAAGLLHNDFKPSNVMVAVQGSARVTDFGLARSDSWLDRDRTEQPLGTPAYLAPERLTDAEIDARSDQFSFSAALYEALFGHLPFPAKDLQTYRERVQTEKPVPPKPGHGVPAWVCRALERGLEVDAERRFPTLDDLLTALSPTVRQRRRRRTAGFIGGLVATASLVGYLALTGPPTPPCGGGEARMAGIWDGDRREALRKALAATQLPFAGEMQPWLEHSLDQYRSEWLAMYADACEATHLRGEQSQRMLDRRMFCLDDRLAEFDAQTSELLRVDEASVHHASDIVNSLRSVSMCGDRVELDQLNLPILDAEERAEVEAARAEIEAQHARFQARGQVDVGVVEQNLGVARRLAYSPLESRALQIQAYHTSRVEGDFETSIEFLYGALRAAMRGNDRIQQVILYSALIETAGYELARMDESHRWLGFGEATLKALGPGHEELDRLLQHAAGRVALETSELDEAKRRLQRALTLGEGLWGPEDPRLASTLTDLSIAIDRGGSPEEAIDLLKRSLDLHATAHGRSSPKLGPALVSLGGALAVLGRYEEALEATGRALHLLRQAYGHDHWESAYPETLVGQILVALDRPTEAIPHLQQGRRLVAKSLGERHPLMATISLSIAEAHVLEQHYSEARALTTLVQEIDLPEKHQDRAIHALLRGRIAIDQGDFRRGETWLRQAQTLVAEPLSGPDLLNLETALGITLLEQGHMDEAAARFETVLERGAGRDRHIVGEARFGLARIRYERGDSTAVAMARQAREELTQGSPRTQWVRDTVDRWLASTD